MTTIFHLESHPQTFHTANLTHILEQSAVFADTKELRIMNLENVKE
jgi:hypothetical protein